MLLENQWEQSDERKLFFSPWDWAAIYSPHPSMYCTFPPFNTLPQCTANSVSLPQKCKLETWMHIGVSDLRRRRTKVLCVWRGVGGQRSRLRESQRSKHVQCQRHGTSSSSCTCRFSIGGFKPFQVVCERTFTAYQWMVYSQDALPLK